MLFPSHGHSSPVVMSTMRILTPGMGRPAFARIRNRSSAGSSASTDVTCESDPTGPVSVIPQPWTSSRPYRSSKVWIIDFGTAEPPPVISRSEEMSRSGCCSRYCRSPIHTVGTPSVTVTRSVSMRSTSVSASAENCPAYTWFAPTIAAAQGWPHAFAWNIGTTGSTVS